MLELLTTLASPHGDPARVNALVAENLASARPLGQYGLLMLVCEQEEDLLGLARLVRALRKRAAGRPLAAVLERARQEAADEEAPHLLGWLIEQHGDDLETATAWHAQVAPEAVRAIQFDALIGHDHRLRRYWGLWRRAGASVVYEAEVWDEETLSDNHCEPTERQRTPHFEVVAPDFATFVADGLAVLTPRK